MACPDEEFYPRQVFPRSILRPNQPGRDLRRSNALPPYSQIIRTIPRPIIARVSTMVLRWSVKASGSPTHSCEVLQHRNYAY